MFCIHGNHEERPENIRSYKTKKFHNGIVYYEEEYPNILFAKDAEIYDFNGYSVLVIGGAYSVDKEYRLMMGYNWYPSEQPSEETKNKVKKVLEEHNNKVDIIDKEGKLPCSIQIKHTIATPQYFTIREESTVPNEEFCII